MAKEQDKNPSKDVTRFMADARGGQVTVDLEAWASKLEAFIERQPEIRGGVAVSDVTRPATGTAGGNAYFTAQLDHGDGIRSQRLLVRYAPPKGVFHEYDMPSMFRILAALQGTGVPAPKPYWIDETGENLGVPAFIMEFLEGSVPRQSYFTEGPVAEANASERRTMVSSVIKTVAKVHAVDWEARGLAFLKNRGQGNTLIECDIGWYWGFLKATLPDRVEAYVPIRQWLLDNQPSAGRPVLNHGDCQLGNYMFQGTEVCGVLDWEITCLAPPETDLAYLCVFNEYLKSGMEQLPEGIPPEEEWLAEYERESGHRVQDWEYYRTMMLYRLAVIFCCGSARVFPPERLESMRAVWGWFEDTLMKEASDRVG